MADQFAKWGTDEAEFSALFGTLCAQEKGYARAHNPRQVLEGL